MISKKELVYLDEVNEMCDDERLKNTINLHILGSSLEMSEMMFRNDIQLVLLNELHPEDIGKYFDVFREAYNNYKLNNDINHIKEDIINILGK